jgi:hypothetical protein
MKFEKPLSTTATAAAPEGAAAVVSGEAVVVPGPAVC